MDFTIFDTGDPRSPGSGEQKNPDKALSDKAAGDKLAAGTPPNSQRIPHGADRARGGPPTRPGANELAKPRFPRGYLLTVCTLIIQGEDADASRILANLFRALYYDETAFNFGTLNRLGALNREHAERLIAAKLAGAYAPVEWERAFALIEDYAEPFRPAVAAGDETDDGDDSLVDLRERHPAPAAPQIRATPPEPAARPEPRLQPDETPTISQTKSEQPRESPYRQPIEKSQPAPVAKSGPGPTRQLTERTGPRPTRQPTERTGPRPARQPTERTGPRPAINPVQSPFERVSPRTNFNRAESSIGFVRTEPPIQLDTPNDERPVTFTVPSDSLRQASGAFESTRREPVIDIDMPLHADRETEVEPERGGHDKLMYGLLVLIVIAALAFVAVNYTLFYKGGGISGFGKSSEASGVVKVGAQNVGVGPAILREHSDLPPVSQKKPSPPRGMVFTPKREINAESSPPPPSAAEIAAGSLPSPSLTAPVEAFPTTSSSISDPTTAATGKAAPERLTIRKAG